MKEGVFIVIKPKFQGKCIIVFTFHLFSTIETGNWYNNPQQIPKNLLGNLLSFRNRIKFSIMSIYR
jgi:hypothetical protein